MHSENEMFPFSLNMFSIILCVSIAFKMLIWLAKEIRLLQSKKTVMGGWGVGGTH